MVERNFCRLWLPLWGVYVCTVRVEREQKYSATTGERGAGQRTYQADYLLFSQLRWFDSTLMRRPDLEILDVKSPSTGNPAAEPHYENFLSAVHQKAN